MYAKNYSPSAEKEDGSCTYYTKGNITKLELISIPELDLNGDSWDDDSEADIFVRYTDSADVVKHQTPEILNVILPITWNIPSDISFSTNEGDLYLKIYEADEFTIESIGILPINFADYAHNTNNELEKYPDSIVLKKNEVELKVFINWTE